MILVDTSVVIDYTRSGDPRPGDLPGEQRGHLRNHKGRSPRRARSPKHRGRLVAALNSFFQVPIPESLWDEIGDSLLALRTGGVTVPFTDVVIAAVAIHNDLELWTHDGQFAYIQRVLPRLKFFQPPP